MSANKPKVTPNEIDYIAEKTVKLMQEYVKLAYSRDTTTFDLRDIRKKILEKADMGSFQIDTFKSMFDQMWRVWPDD